MLNKVVDQFGKDHTYSAMSPTLNHAHPDDSYSRIPYDKGHIFLTYLEQQIGRPQFSNF
jgi:leukotriene-A4 hydrolase